jgi:multiple sugar transport system permease protein
MSNPAVPNTLGTESKVPPTTRPYRRTLGANIQKGSKTFFVTGFTLAILIVFLAPFAFMVLTSLKTPEQISIVGAPIWPAKQPTFEYNGKQVEVFTVPINTCDGFAGTNGTRSLAMVKKGAKASMFVDPENVAGGEFSCAVSWRKLDRPWIFSPTWSNYTEVWSSINVPRLLWNTTYYAIMTEIGVLISCTLVAYGFSRFRFPGRDFLFMLLISTIFLPGFVTLIPTYTLFQRIGWVGSWLPLIVPAFFANAYDVFLLRQCFMTLPRELDEAAMMDGASPFRILWSIILPQSLPALMAVTVFHIVYAWNDYFGPLIYLSTNREAWPMSVALSTFNGIYGQKPQLIQAGAMMTLIAPLILFVVAQRFFIQGIVVTGVEK